MRPAPDSVPQLRRGCRFSESAEQQAVLLVPEGVLELSGPGRRIIEACDGRRTLAEVVQTLRATFPAADPARIEADTVDYLERLHDRQVIEY